MIKRCCFSGYGWALMIGNFKILVMDPILLYRIGGIDIVFSKLTRYFGISLGIPWSLPVNIDGLPGNSVALPGSLDRLPENSVTLSGKSSDLPESLIKGQIKSPSPAESR